MNAQDSLNLIRAAYGVRDFKTLKAYHLMWFRQHIGIDPEQPKLASYAWLSHCWKNNLPDTYKPILKK